MELYVKLYLDNYLRKEDLMKLVRENAASIKLADFDKLQGKRVEEYSKYYKELAFSFLDKDALKAVEDEVAYRVYSIKSKDEDNEYLMGITKIEPTLVNNECTFTRGHFHLDKKYGEVYMGLEGEGFVLYWDGEKDAFLEKVYKGSVHIIDGKYAHRLINTGDIPMSVITVWSKYAGHDYDSIEKSGFPLRVFKENGEIKIVEK